MVRKNNISAAAVAYAAFVLFGSLVSIINSNFNILSNHYGVGLAEVSFMISAMAVGRVSTILFSGIVADRTGRKPVIISAMVCIALCYALVPLVKNYYAGLGLFMLAGMGHGMADASATALVFDCFRENSDGPIGLIQAFFCLGAISTPVITGLLMDSGLGFGLLFQGLSILAILALGAAVFIKFPEKSVGANENQASTPFAREPSLRKDGPVIAITVLLYSIATTMLTTWSGTYGMEILGLSQVASINVLAFYNAGCITGTLFMSRLLKRIHPTKLLIVNVLCLFLFVCIFAFNRIISAVPVLFVSMGVFAGINYSLILSTVGELFPKRKATASGGVMGMSALGAIITPLFSGGLYIKYGIIPAYATIFIAFLGLGFTSLLFRRRYVAIIKGANYN